MIYEARAHPHLANGELHLFQFTDLDCAGKIFPTHRKERQFHLRSQNRGEPSPSSLVTEHFDRVLCLVSRQEKRQTLNVVPMSVGKEKRQAERRVSKFTVQCQTQFTDA